MKHARSRSATLSGCPVGIAPLRGAKVKQNQGGFPFVRGKNNVNIGYRGIARKGENN